MTSGIASSCACALGLALTLVGSPLLDLVQLLGAGKALAGPGVGVGASPGGQRLRGAAGVSDVASAGGGASAGGVGVSGTAGVSGSGASAAGVGVSGSVSSSGISADVGATGSGVDVSAGLSVSGVVDSEAGAGSPRATGVRTSVGRTQRAGRVEVARGIQSAEPDGGAQSPAGIFGSEPGGDITSFTERAALVAARLAT